MDPGLHMSKHSKALSTQGLRKQVAAVIIYSLFIASLVPGCLTLHIVF